tara:strand:- start:81747 stop:82448 length:702 start_codon:yes stop_codon:yes gene_type:complete
MIKAVFFDLYNTLAGFRPSRFEIQSRALKDFGITPTNKGILKGYALADKFMASQKSIMPLENLSKHESDYFFAKYESLILEGDDIKIPIEQCAKIWNTITKIPYQMTLYDDVLPVLTELKNLHLRLGMISNMGTPGMTLSKEMGLNKIIDLSITSQDAGFTKPDIRIFQFALNQLNLQASDAVFIGDQIESDIIGAENAGLITVLIDRDENHPNFSRCTRITTLKKLTAALPL